MNNHWDQYRPLRRSLPATPVFRHALALLTAVLTTAMGTTATEAQQGAVTNAAKQPNIVWILADDLGYADLGFQGGQQIATPHLDALAASGARFTSGYVSGPYCSPTRAGLLTGRYQQRFGHEFNPSQPGAGLAAEETTAAEQLQAAGYRTGLIGKWHLGNRPEQHPQSRGFEHFYGFLGGANAFLPDDSGSVPNVLAGRESVAEKRYLTDAIGQEAIAFIRQPDPRPYFLFLSFNAVHTPMHADDERLAKFSHIADPQRRIYAAMLSALDDAVGQLVEELRSQGQEEQTLIAFLSDNGGPTMPTTTINASLNAPLRGSKRQTLEGGIRVPFVISWKSVIEPGQVIDDPIIQLDLLPTALAAAGAPTTSKQPLDGVNLLPFLTGDSQDAPHAALFWRFGQQTAVRHGDWKLVRYGRTHEIDANESWPKLYNLADDIGETHDLASQHPQRVEQLQKLWDQWDADNVTPSWGGSRPRR